MRFIKFVLMILIVSAVSLSLVGCDRIDFSTVVAKQYEDGAVIEVSDGELFSLLLDSNATTGYEWQISEGLDDSIIVLVDSQYIASENGLAGQGGKQRWVFKVIGIGEVGLAFKYVRPWIVDEVARQISYTVKAD
jgi:inhibitor of cysteine peptidase